MLYYIFIYFKNFIKLYVFGFLRFFFDTETNICVNIQFKT